MSHLSKLLQFTAPFIAQEQKMCEEFKKRAEQAKQNYWDACKLPRKIKKRVRKEAINDYNFYTELSKPATYS